MNLLLQMTLSSTLLITVIVLIRALVMHKLPKRAFMALWYLALFQLVIPFSIPSQASIFNLFGMNNNMPAPTGLPIPPMTDVINFVMPQGQESFPVTDPAFMDVTGAAAGIAGHSRFFDLEPLALVYLAGLVLSTMLFTLLYRKSRTKFDTSLPVSSEFLTNWLEKHKLKRRISIRVSDQIAAPLTYGIWRPVILLPKGTDWNNERELNYVLAHEFIHIKRFDTLTKLVMTAALCIHWFNPIAWGMYFLLNRDMEISCDEAVIHTLGETSKQDYARTLISMMERKSHLPALYNNFSKYAIEERITAIMKMKKRTIIGTIMALLMVATTATVFATLPTPAYEASPLRAAEEYSINQTQFQWPVETFTRITGAFGSLTNPVTGEEEQHNGIDIPAPEGTPILAAKDGYVIHVYAHGRYGNMIVMSHANGYSTMYAHASATHVEIGQFVQQGAHIADVGSTGMSTGPHLHFEIRMNDIAIDPLAFFSDVWDRSPRTESVEPAQNAPVISDLAVYEILTERDARFLLRHIGISDSIWQSHHISFADAAKIAAEAIYREFGVCIDGLTGHMLFVDRMYDDVWSGFIVSEELTTHAEANELFHFVIDANTGEVSTLYMNTPETPFNG